MVDTQATPPSAASLPNRARQLTPEGEQMLRFFKKLPFYVIMGILGLAIGFYVANLYYPHVSQHLGAGNLYYTSNLTYNGSFYSVAYVFNESTADCSVSVYINKSVNASLVIVPYLSTPNFKKVPYNYVINHTAPYLDCIYRNKT